MLSETHYLEIIIGQFSVCVNERCDFCPIKKQIFESDEEQLLSNINLVESEPISRTYLLDDKEPKVIQLNESGSAYILVDYLPEHLSENASNTFDSMWQLHPELKHKIIMYEKEVEVHRYSQSYLNTWTDLSHTKFSSYMYSGFDTSSNNEILPNIFVDYYKWIQEQDPKYNQVIVNWYGDQFDYIASHSNQKGV